MKKNYTGTGLMRDDLSESVKKHVIQHIANCNKILSRKEIMKYLKSKEFF